MTLCGDILELDENIRWVEHFDRVLRPIEAKMRKGLKSITSRQTDEEFFGVLQPIILKICSKLEREMGRLKVVMIKYEKASVIAMRLPDVIIALTMEPGDTTPVREKIGKKYGIDLL